MILRCFLVAGILAQLETPTEPAIEVPDNHGPQLVDDVRYTPENAAYYRRLGLVIDEKYVTEESGAPASVNAPMRYTIWNNRPFTDSKGNTRYRVYYGFFDGTLDDTSKGKIRKNLQTLQDQICITFEETTDEAKYAAEGVIRFIKSSGCFSGLGRSGSSRISIGNGCTSDGTIQHEVMHSLGFHHEQVRPDRDDYVVIHFGNIRSGMEHNFNAIKESQWWNQDINYDIGSVMQYGGYGFSTNGQPTITYKENGVDTGKATAGQRTGASSMDIWQICKLYNCDKCTDQMISSYDGPAHKDYLFKCSDAFERYFWKSRCYDRWAECANGDDEDINNIHCNPEQTTTTTTTTTISPSLCGEVTGNC